MEKEKLFATKTLGTSRRNSGLTQQEFADLLSVKLGQNVSLAVYIKWEQGIRPIKTEVAVAISRELGQSVKILFTRGQKVME